MKLPYIIKAPIITERSMDLAGRNEYTFSVAREATKGQIKQAFEDYFGVEVIAVRTNITKGKTKRAGKARKTVIITDTKKAIIKVKAGQKLTLFDAQE